MNKEDKVISGVLDYGKLYEEYKKEYDKFLEETGFGVLSDIAYGKQSQKSKLLDILKTPANKLIAVDLDGTLCKGQFRKEGDEVKPIKERIDFINSLYCKGGHIIIWTARFPKRYEITRQWLEDNGVMYHGISMHTKIGADLYIDDKALNIDDIFNS